MSPDPIARRNAANAQYSTGPRTAEGKAVSGGNAEVHGFCSVEPRTEEDRVEAAALYAMLAAELKPVTPMEVEAVRDAANADQRRRRIGRALEDVGAASIVSRREERKDRLATDREQCQADLEFWQSILDRPPTVGQGLAPAVLEAVLGRFGVGSKHRAEDPRAHLVQFHQVFAKGDGRLRQAMDAWKALAQGEQIGQDDRLVIEGALRSCEGLAKLFSDCVARATETLAASSGREERNRAKPERADDWFDDSKRTQLLHRYRAEAERAYYRALRSFDAIRRRQDAERRQLEREQRQARKAAQEAEKAARQAARQAEIVAKAKPHRDELTARVVEPFVAKASQRNEPRSAASSAEPNPLKPVTSSVPAPTPAAEGPRTIRRRGKAIAIEARRPSTRR